MGGEPKVTTDDEVGEGSRKVSVAIVGGGPGGLFAVWHLQAKLGDACEIVVFEASERLGGKIATGQMEGVGPYEAGVAEIYDYSRLGPDPLDEDVTDFVSEEIDKTKFTSDRRDKSGELQARFLEGTGFDEDNIAFKAIAIDPGGNAGLIELVIYADPTEMNKPANKDFIDRIVRSFKPN